MPNRPDEVTADKEIAAALALPMRKDLAPELAPGLTEPSQKDIHKTVGGKITDFFIYDVLGFGANAGLSLGVTYYLNPKPFVKNMKASIQNTISKSFGNSEYGRIINRVAEIGFMLISGTALTFTMAPLVKRRDRIAHWINTKLGKDTDVLPEHLIVPKEPVTLEDRLEQEIKKRVNRHQTSGDLWKARWLSVLVPLVGEGFLAKGNKALEAKNIPSLDTVAWRTGQKLHDEVLPKNWVSGLSNFFKNHGASIADMKENSLENYIPLEKLERQTNLGQVNEGRMMIADQTRLFAKEVGWTLILASFVQKLTSSFQRGRIERQEKKAIAEITKEGWVPEGYKIVLEEGVKLEKLAIQQDQPEGKWVAGTSPAARPQKTESYVKAVDATRAESNHVGV